jgi:hypothetical protein
MALLSFLGQVMSHKPKGKPPEWSELAVLLMMGWLVLFGLATSRRTLPEWLMALGVGAFVLFYVRLWDLTLRQARTSPPLTRGQCLGNAAFFLAGVAVTGLLLWWLG